MIAVSIFRFLSTDHQLQLNVYQFYFCLPEVTALVNSGHQANTYRKVIKYNSLKIVLSQIIEISTSQTFLKLCTTYISPIAVFASAVICEKTSSRVKFLNPS